MTLAALVDCGADPDAIAGRIGALGLSEVRLEFTPTMRHGFRALRLDVHHPPEHAHRHLRDIEAMIDRGDLSPRARRMALSVFQKVAEAEARVHGTTVEQVHFHEVGAVDSIVDIVGVAVAIDLLGIDRIVAAPPVTGTGIIRIAHGRVSVPAPATIEILRGIPVRGSHIEAELTTPTGAAILAALADDFGPMPSMRIERTGCGAGHRELQEQANVLRAVVGELASAGQDVVWLLETNLDDATGEQIGYAMAQIMQSGALDVFATPIFMKKNRPATLVSALCRPADRQAVESCMLLYTPGPLPPRRSTRFTSRPNSTLARRLRIASESPSKPSTAKRWQAPKGRPRRFYRRSPTHRMRQPMLRPLLERPTPGRKPAVTQSGTIITAGTIDPVRKLRPDLSNTPAAPHRRTIRMA